RASWLGFLLNPSFRYVRIRHNTVKRREPDDLAFILEARFDCEGGCASNPMELARGQVTDRPWGISLAALGARQCTGQLTLQAEGKQYCIVFDQGGVVGAPSPLASDSAARVALIHHMIAPTQVA